LTLVNIILRKKIYRRGFPYSSMVKKNSVFLSIFCVDLFLLSFIYLFIFELKFE
jgi:hypothetical protein